MRPWMLFPALIACDGSATVLQSPDAGDGGDAADDRTEASVALGNNGVIELYSRYSPTASPPEDSSSVLAVFSLATQSSCPPEVIVDGCSVVDCAPPLNVPVTNVSAGTLLINGTKQPLSLVPNAEHYPSNPISTRLWEGGEAISLVASGDAAPAFSLSLIAPKYVVVTTPTWPTGNSKLPVARSVPLDFVWTGGDAGQVTVLFTAQLKTPGIQLVSCSFPATAGHGTISTNVLAKLTTNAQAISIAITTNTRVQTTIKDWTMTFHAQAFANVPNGTAGRDVDLQ